MHLTFKAARRLYRRKSCFIFQIKQAGGRKIYTGDKGKDSDAGGGKSDDIRIRPEAA